MFITTAYIASIGVTPTLCESNPVIDTSVFYLIDEALDETVGAADDEITARMQGRFHKQL